MLNYVLAEFTRFLIVGPWKGESQRGFPYTDNIPAQATLATIPGTTIPYATIVIALIAAVVIYVLMYRTKFGYEVRVLGENADAARYAGIDAARVTLLIMLVSGGLAGIAGFSEIAANHKHMTLPGHDLRELRLHRHHRRVARAAGPPLGVLLFALFRRNRSRWQQHPDLHGPARSHRAGVQRRHPRVPHYERILHEKPDPSAALGRRRP